jgi:hypothetical protein
MRGPDGRRDYGSAPFESFAGRASAEA